MRMHSVSTVPTQEQPTRPPGLLPLPGERLWKPHEDKYWHSIREMWGSDVDLTDPEHEEDARRSSSPCESEPSPSDSKDEMRNEDLCTANGTVFRIILPGQAQNTTVERDINLVTAGGRTSSEGTTGAPRTSINHTPLSNAIALHLPPPVVQKPTKGRRAFQGHAINVSVTTTTRTYGDFSTMNPPPYTPRPTGRERSFGRSGNMSAEKEKKTKWPVAKWLFILGFVFPLLWLFGSFLLLSGLRKLSADAERESQNDAKTDTLPYDTTESVTHLIAQEVVWSKRCAWAFTALAALCFAVLGILKGLGM